MASDNQINLPSTFAGITRFKEEYHSIFKLKPVAIIGFIIAIVAFVLLLRWWYPVIGA